MEFNRQRRNIFKAVVSGGLAVAGVSALSRQPSAEAAEPSAGPTPRGLWRARSPLPVKRAEVGVAAVGGRMYVVGGTVQKGDETPVWATTEVHSYDPRQDRWSSHAPLPKPLTHAGVAALDGRLYVFGGFTSPVHMNPQRDAYVYDPRRDVWDRLPEMPVALGSIAVAAVDGRLHLLGGRDSHRVVTPQGSPFSLGYGIVRTHYVFDPRRNTYVTAEPLPVEGRDHAGVAVLGDLIHVVGGRVEDVDDNLTRHDVYDVRRRRWVRAAPLSTARSAGAAVVLDGRLVYAGGECRPGSSTDTFDDVTVYDPRTDRWSAVTALPGSRHGFGAAQIGNRAYFVAGSPSCGGGASADTLELTIPR
ncbi:N-acetylneuraminic acid mutarotase [Streptomyces sp. V3I8]|uniref:Kelch repeat-containing protein n=1 Tax=Streptomyces sp. V3I8 TaxID=3042279 RepID=UPI002781C847|nr:kelch repeat-containing protein [Streptomyces sp. V3I8]MDQ1040141.1 N-acetylneuraminic acid mutarotase [Streptomyces sp. V3I8]